MKFYVSNLPLLEGQETTNLSNSGSVGDTTLTVLNGLGFGLSKYVLVGSFGDENAEIALTHSATASTYTTITLASALTKNHNIDDPITLIDYNQVEFSRATASGGTKTVLTTISIEADQKETRYDDITNSTGYGYIRFKNGSTYSSYSAEVPYTGYLLNSVYAIKKSALRLTNYKLEQGEEVELTESDLLDLVNECQEEVWNKEQRLSCFEEHDSSSTTTASTPTISIPSGFTPQSGSITYGTTNQPLTYISRKKYLDYAIDATVGTPYYYNVWDGLIYFWPTPNVATTVYIDFYKKPTKLTADSDTVVVPASIVKYYLMSKIEDIRRDSTQADKYEKKYQEALNNYIEKDETTLPQEYTGVEILDPDELYSENSYLI